MIRTTLLFATLAVSACSTFVPRTMLQLMALSPLTADPEALAVQIDLPEAFGIVPGSAKFIVTQTYIDETETFEFVLARTGNVFRIAPDDIATLRAFQQRAQQLEKESPDEHSGSISVFATPCLNSPDATIAATASVAFQLAQDGPFLPLFTDQPLSALFGPADVKDLPACDAP